MITSIVPITVATFLYESVMQEKLRIMDLVLIFMIGTTASFLATGILNTNLGDAGLNTVLVAPIIEEIAKAIPIIIAIKIMKIKRVSSAIFVGWLVGSGFQIAETLGYATYYGYMGIFSQIEVLPGGTEYIFTGTLNYSVMFLRFFYSFGAHAFWGAIHGAAFIFASKSISRKSNIGRLAIWFSFCVIMHMIWNANSVYTNNQVLNEVFSVFIQLLYFPLFFYLLDAGLRDNKECMASIASKEVMNKQSIIEDIVKADIINKEEATIEEK